MVLSRGDGIRSGDLDSNGNGRTWGRTKRLKPFAPTASRSRTKLTRQKFVDPIKRFCARFFFSGRSKERKSSTEVLESIQKQQKEASYGTNLILTKVRGLLNFLPSQDLKRKVGNLIGRSRTHRNFGRASTATKTKNWSQRKNSKLRTTTVKVCQTTWKETFPDVQIHLWPKLFLIGVLAISREKL